MSADALILMSGGIESTVLTHALYKEGKSIAAINFDMHTAPSIKQIHYSKKAMFAFGRPIEIVSLPGIARMTAGFVDPTIIIADEGDTRCPDESFVPALIVTAVYYAQLARIPEVYVGLTSEQIRAETGDFIKQVGPVFRKYEPGNTSVQVHTPFDSMTKLEVIEKGVNLGVDLNETWSCFNGEAQHCGTCPACLERKKAFQAASVVDPTTYLN